MTSQQVFRGNDMVTAVGTMGLAGSMLGCSRLVIWWEHADLCTALRRPDADTAPMGLVVVEAQHAAAAAGTRTPRRGWAAPNFRNSLRSAGPRSALATVPAGRGPSTARAG